MSKAKKLMTKTNRSAAGGGIRNMASNSVVVSNVVVGYSNVMPFTEHDTGTGNTVTNVGKSIIKKCNKDTLYSSNSSGNGNGNGNSISTSNTKINTNINISGSNSSSNSRKRCCSINDASFGVEDNNNNNNESNKNENTNVVDVYDETDAYVDVDDDDDGETDSLASMETLSDNVAIWVDGERHWISGVDANTTCMDLICALLNYQTGQQMFSHQTTTTKRATHNNQDVHLNGNADNAGKGDVGGVVGDKGDGDDDGDGDGNDGNNKNSNNNGNIGINQSMPIMAAGNQQQQESVRAAVYHKNVNCHDNQNISTSRRNNASTKATTTTTTTTSTSLASEYVIVKQHRHCEEYLDGNAKVFDVLQAKTEEGLLREDGKVIGTSQRKECELFLRRLVSSSSAIVENHAGTSSTLHRHHQHQNHHHHHHNNGHTQVASLLSTDKDSGMGSPVGSSRSARFRRRKYKSSSSWFSQGNTLHPKVALQRGCVAAAAAAIAVGNANDDKVANERLMRIILAQDETIQRQLTLLREKEKQICKIEEEKHRVRERELGKNYLLETYFKGLDEAAAVCEYKKNIDDDEIFIDEPYQPKSENIETTAASMGTIATIANSLQRGSRHIKNFGNFRQQEIRCQKELSNRLGNNNTTSNGVKAKSLEKSDDDGNRNGDGNGDGGGGVGDNDNVIGGDGGDDDDDDIAASPCDDVDIDIDVDVDGDGDVDVFVGNVDNQKEIELQIFWLEKVYALNKHLQREEETLLKLHAKIRKHQVRCAYQMKNDVLEQIDELDAKLALQCADICRVEDNLVISDQQLKGKLNILEMLNAELQAIHDVQAAEATSNATETSTSTSTLTTTVTATSNNEMSKENSDFKSNKSIITADDVAGVDDSNVDGINYAETESKRAKPIIELSTISDPLAATTIRTQQKEQKLKCNLNQKISFGEIAFKTNQRNIKVNDDNNAATTTAIVAPSTKLASVSVRQSSSLTSMLKQKQKQPKHQMQNLNEALQQHNHQQQQQYHYGEEHPQQLLNYPITCVNQFEQSAAIATDMKIDINANASATATAMAPTMTTLRALSDKNISPQQHVPLNVKIVNKPMYEELSMNEIATIPLALQPKLPTTAVFAIGSPPTLPLLPLLNDDAMNGLELSHLGTLV